LYTNKEGDNLFSETISVRSNTFITQNNSLNYTLNIIDTPGLFEIKPKLETARTNEEITSTIMDCLRNEITKINKIFFVFSKRLGLQHSNVESINLFLDKYPSLIEKCNLIVTGCEDEDIDDLLKLEDTLKKSTIKNIEKMEVLFSGCIDYKLYKRKDFSTIKLQHNRIKEFRNLILKRIFDANDYMKIDAIMKYNIYSEECDNLIKRLEVEIDQQFNGSNIIKNEQYYNKWMEIAKSIFRLTENPLFNFKASVGFRNKITKIEKEIDKDIKIKEIFKNLG